MVILSLSGEIIMDKLEDVFTAEALEELESYDLKTLMEMSSKGKDL